VQTSFLHSYVLILPLIILSLLCAYLAWPTTPHELWVSSAINSHKGLKQGQEIVSRFTFVNNYRQQVNITQVAPSCSCTSAQMGNDELLPGQAADLTVRWKTGRSRGYAAASILVIYQLSDGSTHKKILKVEGEVTPDILVDQSEIRFVTNIASCKVIHFSPGGIEEASVSNVFCSHSAFTARREGANSVIIAFDPSKWNAQDHSDPQLIMSTNSLNEPHLAVKIRVENESMN
jgi:hypothetical protein